MRKALYAVMLMATACYVAPASAVGPGDLGDLTNTAVSIGNSFDGTAFGTSFSDVYTFDLNSLSQSVGTTVTINLAVGPVNFELSNMTVALTDSTGFITYDFDNSLDAGNTLQVSSILNAGTGYRFVVTGDVAGTSGGAYGGVLQAAPVPEAETYAMMLAGLGLVGFMARRRSLSVI